MTIRRFTQDALFLKGTMPDSETAKPDIIAMGAHIISAGLLNPLIVTEQQGRYIILDGAKRFQAIKMLARRNMLPRSLSTIPCIVTDETDHTHALPAAPMLMAPQELVHNIIAGADAGMTNAQIKYEYACSDEIISQALQVQKLHPKLKLAFCKGVIDLQQAAAFSTLPNQQSQWELLVKLGPFISDAGIMKAIALGQTVIELSTGEIIILPSRARNVLPARSENANKSQPIAA